MQSKDLFAMALHIDTPWHLTSVDFKDSDGVSELHIEIDFEKGSRFPDSDGELCSLHDTKRKTWRHLNFFEHACYLHCRVPRIKNKAGKVSLVQVPWARAGSGFTLLFESYAMALIEREMPINKIGELVGEHAYRIWTIFNYWIERAYKADTIDSLTSLGIDETSRRKGHKYITVAVDMDERRVIHVTEGKDKNAVKQVKKHIESKGVPATQVEHASMDMSASFISGVKTYFPNAEIHFDRFHVVKLLNEAMNEVRKQERKEHDALKGHKYTVLKNKDKLPNKKKKELADMIKLYPTLGEAYRLKELFNDVWEMGTEEEATAFLVDWCNEVDASDIAPFKAFVRTVKAHWTGIVNFCETEINNGILEGLNSKIQLAKRRARGYRRTSNFINMIYFLCGKLTFDYPLNSS